MSDGDMSGYHPGIDTWRDANAEISRLRDRIEKLEAKLTGHVIAESILKDRINLLIGVLEMVRDADDDCHADGLQTIPKQARARIDEAIDAAT
jgi:hypothetical protein